MRSFIIACVLLSLVILFVCLNSFATVRTLDEMLSLSAMLPETAEDFRLRYEDYRPTAEKLWSLWNEKFSRIAFTAGYENTNRCDEAIGALKIHFQNKNAQDFTVSLSEFRDALKRLRHLESFPHFSLRKEKWDKRNEKAH